MAILHFNDVSEQIAQAYLLEMINSLESNLSQKSLLELKAKVSAILDGIPSRKVPDWDLL